MYRVIQWATGNVGRAAVDGIVAHPRRRGRARRAERLPREADEGVGDDDDDRRPERRERDLDRRHRAEPRVRRGRQRHQHRRRQDERHAPGDEPRHSRAQPAEVDRHLGRVRTGEQVRHREQVEEALAVEPAAPADAFLLLQRDVRRGPPKALTPRRRNTTTTSCSRRRLSAIERPV
jgi:hypothetical protein